MAKNVDDLRAKNLPRLNWRDLFTGAETCDSEEAAAMDAYFRAFLPPGDGCVSCGATQGGMMAALMGGGFRYGIVHGEGVCSGCGWPARANHYDVGPIQSLAVILQYHPDEVESKKEGAA